MKGKKFNFVVNVIDVVNSAPDFLVWVEKCEQTLEQYIKTINYTPMRVLQFLEQIFKGQYQLRELGVIQADLNLQTIYVDSITTSEPIYQVNNCINKLSYFRPYQQPSDQLELYKAPEFNGVETYDDVSDIFSVNLPNHLSLG